VNQRRGLRSQSSKEYLRRPPPEGLSVVTGAFVRRILFEGRQAVGVEFVHGSEVTVARARGEIVLSAGAVASPKILMMSGIGPRDELARHGIPMVLESPGVGMNLHDHCAIPIHFHTVERTLNRLGPVDVARAAGSWILKGTGPIAISPIQAQLFGRIDPSSPSPDLQLGFCSFAVTREVDANGRSQTRVSRTPGVGVVIVHLHPQARGRIRLRSGDPADTPVIEHELLAPEDLSFMVDAVDTTRHVMGQQAFRGVVGDLMGSEGKCRTTADWRSWITQNATHGMHVVGTCKMGVDDLAVVDSQLRVHGVSRLRVIDASVMPSITSGNTNAPAMMVGERGAAALLR
jgi:choline dehydrogenase